VDLLQRVVAGDESAWQIFVETYAGFLYSLAWPYSRGDADLASELVVVALEGLRRSDAGGRPYYRLRKYLETLSRFGRRSKFVTWLALVVKNLFRDWFREQSGRRWLPKQIEGLSAAAQALFEALFWDGLTQPEALARLRRRWPALGDEEFDGLVGQVFAALDDRQLFRLYQDLLSRMPAFTADESADATGRLGVFWSQAAAGRPDLALEQSERQRQADHLGQVLREALAALPATAREVVQLLALRGLSGEQVRRVMGFRKRQRVYDEMAKARRRLRAWLERAGVTTQQVRDSLGWLDDLPEVKNLSSFARSEPDLRRGLGESPVPSDEEV
jgi:RNA polymerase sigma factor (sigma-70 family)